MAFDRGCYPNGIGFDTQTFFVSRPQLLNSTTLAATEIAPLHQLGASAAQVLCDALTTPIYEGADVIMAPRSGRVQAGTRPPSENRHTALNG